MNMKQSKPAAPSVVCNFEGLPGAFKDGSLKSFIQWRPKWDDAKFKYLKAPVDRGWQRAENQQGLSQLEQTLLMVNAAESVGGVGFVASGEHSFIIIDLDNVNPETIPLLAKVPTYIERSPSWGLEGKGQHRYHAVYRLKSADDKQHFQSHPTIKISSDSQIELFVASGYVCCTGARADNLGEISANQVTTLEYAELLAAFPEAAKNRADVLTLKDERSVLFPGASKIPSLSAWASCVSCLRGDPIVDKLMVRQGVTYNSYWVNGVTALHAVGMSEETSFSLTEAYDAALQFSDSAGDDFDQGEFDGLWNRLCSNDRGESSQHIGIGTYVMYFKAFNIQWPVMTSGSKKKPPVAVATAPENLDAFLDFCGVDFCVDLDGVSVYLFPKSGNLDEILSANAAQYDEEGSPLAIGKFYRDVNHWLSTSTRNYMYVAAIVARQMRALGCPVQSKPIVNMLEDLVVQMDESDFRSRLYRHLMTIPSPKQDLVGAFLDYLVLDDAYHARTDQEGLSFSEDLARTALKKCLFSAVSSIIPSSKLSPGHASATKEAMPILMGGQKQNKSSFFQRLFPPEIRSDYWGVAAADKPVDSADAYMAAAGKLLLEHDECEELFVSNKKARLKSYITKHSNTARAAYHKLPLQVIKTWVDCGSTNEHDLNLPVDGLRRYLCLRVKRCRTFKMDRDGFDQWGLLRQLIDRVTCLSRDMPEQVPWLLTDEEAKRVSAAATEATHESEADGLLGASCVTSELASTLADDFACVPFKDISVWAEYGDTKRPEGVPEEWKSLSLLGVKKLLKFRAPNGNMKLTSPAVKEAMGRYWSDAANQHIPFGKPSTDNRNLGQQHQVMRGGILVIKGRAKYIVKVKSDKSSTMAREAAVE